MFYFTHTVHLCTHKHTHTKQSSHQFIIKLINVYYISKSWHKWKNKPLMHIHSAGNSLVKYSSSVWQKFIKSGFNCLSALHQTSADYVITNLQKKKKNPCTLQLRLLMFFLHFCIRYCGHYCLLRQSKWNMLARWYNL